MRHFRFCKPCSVSRKLCQLFMSLWGQFVHDYCFQYVIVLVLELISFLFVSPREKFSWRETGTSKRPEPAIMKAWRAFLSILTCGNIPIWRSKHSGSKFLCKLFVFSGLGGSRWRDLSLRGLLFNSSGKKLQRDASFWEEFCIETEEKVSVSDKEIRSPCSLLAI